MKEFGISIYPFHSKMQENKDYIDLAAKYGFTRCFMCLLSVKRSKEEIIDEFKTIIGYAKDKGMKTTLDIAPSVFGNLNISYNDLSFFKEIGTWAIRLDLGFGGRQESLMSFNEHNLKIEINMSNETSYIDTIMDYRPNKENIIGCHNFYPHIYTGLERNFFNNCTNKFKEYSLDSAAFITARESTFGPWPVMDGMPTLEEHRNLPIEIQAMDLFLSGIDAVFISNCYANEDSFKKLSELDKRYLVLKAKLVKEIPETEKKIVLGEFHNRRLDTNEYLIRSTSSRIKYKGHNFKLFNPVPDIRRGDILIDSSEYGSYAGELQVALKDMKNTGRTNIVGHIDEEYLFLLDYIKTSQNFRIIE